MPPGDFGLDLSHGPDAVAELENRPAGSIAGRQRRDERRVGAVQLLLGDDRALESRMRRSVAPDSLVIGHRDRPAVYLSDRIDAEYGVDTITSHHRDRPLDRKKDRIAADRRRIQRRTRHVDSRSEPGAEKAADSMQSPIAIDA